MSMNRVVRLTDRTDMTMAVYCGRKTTTTLPNMCFYVNTITAWLLGNTENGVKGHWESQSLRSYMGRRANTMQ